MIGRTSTRAGIDTRISTADATDFQPSAQLLDHEGRRYFIVPATETLLARQRTPDGGTVRLLIQLSGFGNGVVSALSHTELRALGSDMLAAADAIEAEAAEVANAAIDKASGR